MSGDSQSTIKALLNDDIAAAANQIEQRKFEAFDSRFDNAFDQEFVHYCLAQQGLDVTFNQQNAATMRLVGLGVLKNVLRVVEKLEMKGVEQKTITVADVTRAMGQAGLCFLWPDAVEQIMNSEMR